MKRDNIWPKVAHAVRLRVRVWTLLLVCLLAGAVWGATRLGEYLLVSVPVDDPQAIIVLASHEWERLPAAAILAQRFPEANVVLSVPGTINAATCYDCGGRAWRLVERGVAARRIGLMPRRVDNTYAEARAALEYCQASGLQRIIVVTSPYHSRRALATFRRVFATSSIEIGMHPALAESDARPASWWRRGNDRGYVAYEAAALISYWFRYRISLVDTRQ